MPPRTLGAAPVLAVARRVDERVVERKSDVEDAGVIQSPMLGVSAYDAVSCSTSAIASTKRWTCGAGSRG